MFRLRRYRVFIVFAILLIGLLYHFRSIGDIQNAGAASVEGLKKLGHKGDSWKDKPKDAADSDGNDRFNGPVAAASLVASGAASPSASFAKGKAIEQQTSMAANPSVAPKATEGKDGRIINSEETPKPIRGGASRKSNSTSDVSREVSSDHPFLNKPSPVDKSIESPADPITNGEGGGKGRKEIVEDTTAEKIHWSPIPEHFPVPTESLLQLPTGKSSPIPKIQHDFKSEQGSEKLSEPDKLSIIKKSFTFSWQGYREKAWMQDELSPVSGKYRNPFCGWAATLVDSLDTLWLMGLKEEFDEAVDAVQHIDFTTSPRNDIPLFETVIRYLGGLIGAYDISGGTRKLLLDKAVELAEVLMGSFDTPNRMPLVYYLWKPTFTSQPHRAKTRVVLAELGSLSLEFTRLAQITKEAKYYDAIARITNEFEIWQSHTKLPGLWPLKVDASGCKKTDTSLNTAPHSIEDDGNPSKPLSLAEKAAANRAAAADVNLLNSDVGVTPSSKSAQDSTAEGVVKENAPIEGSLGEAPSSAKRPKEADLRRNEPSLRPPEGGDIRKRDASPGPSSPSASEASHTEETSKSRTPDCEPQGFASPPYSASEEFTLGGQADSTYEYLPKEYMLLGGLEPKYRTMYMKAADAAKKHLIFRPMIPAEKRSILQAGLIKATDRRNSAQKVKLQPEGSHLSCFVGGMFAIGAKLFDVKEDMEIAKKLTDGCIWAYEATNTGIMPEIFLSVPCNDTENCPWNETLWKESLDPHWPQREKQLLKQEQRQVLGKETQWKSEDLKGSALDMDDLKASGNEYLVGEVDSPSSFEAKEQVLAAETPLDASPISKNHPGDTLRTESTASLSSTKAKALKDGLLEESDTAEEELLPKHSQTKSKQENPTVPAGAGSQKDALKRRQLGEIDDEKPLVSGPKDSHADLPPFEDSKADVTDKANNLKKQAKAKGASKAIQNADSVAESSKPENTSGNDKEEAVSEIDMHKASSLSSYNNGTNASSKDITKGKLSATKTNNTHIEAQPSESELMTHDDYVKYRIENERLPLGMTKVVSGRYILRPEAIESVFIMYRATGDDYWRKQGWKMFQAVDKYTNATYGASAIRDVTNSNKPKLMDEMESFWLAETLKYFYLLFSDPSVFSLDDYVLNTEAHPLKRPNP